MNMNTPSNNGDLLTIRGVGWYKGRSPEQMQQAFDRGMPWFSSLEAEGTALAGISLQPHGKIVSGAKVRVVSEEAFPESKGTFSACILLKVDSLGDAVIIAEQCPGLPFGVGEEVRPQAAECPVAEELRTASSLAYA